MPNDSKKKYSALVMIAAVVGIGFAGYEFYLLSKEISRNTYALEERVLQLSDENVNLAESLVREQKKNGEFESQIGDIASTVGKLDKLSKTDEELLQKYSKIYFLNENYIPESLKNIPSDYVYQKDKTEEIHSKVFPFLEDLMNAAAEDGINLKIISAYRSFGEQSILKNSYLVTYGSGANKFSADQGYSEHQLGTTVDFTTAELGFGFTNFDSSEAYAWLKENAYKYGFVISYPKNNSYYQYEPWHWRFVGENLAKHLHEDEMNFYDLDQRTIDNYLISIFD